MSLENSDPYRTTFEKLLEEEASLPRSVGIMKRPAQLTSKWQRLCEKMFDLCCRKDPMETMFTFYNTIPSDSYESPPIQEYQQMIQLMKNMLFCYYPDIPPKSSWRAPLVPAQRDTMDTPTWGGVWGGSFDFSRIPPGEFTIGEDVQPTPQALGLHAFFGAEEPSKNPEPKEENPKN